MAANATGSTKTKRGSGGAKGARPRGRVAKSKAKAKGGPKGGSQSGGGAGSGSDERGIWLAIGARLAVHCLPLILLLAGAGFGARQLWRMGMEDERFRIPEGTRVGRSEDFGPSAVAEFERLACEVAAGRSILDPWLLTELRTEYEASPWIRELVSMRRVAPNRVAVEVAPRLPVAQVLQSGFYWLVSADGVMMPGGGSLEPYDGLPIIQGTGPEVLRPRPRPRLDDGRRYAPLRDRIWTCPGVHDALAVLHELRRSPVADELPVRRLIVRRPGFLNRLRQARRSRPRVQVLSAGEVRIDWGTVNRDHVPEEIQPAEKIAMLERLLESGIPLRPGLELSVSTRVPGFRLASGDALHGSASPNQ